MHQELFMSSSSSLHNSLHFSTIISVVISVIISVFRICILVFTIPIIPSSSSEIKLVSVSVNSKDQYASARVTLDVHGKELTEEAEGDGMIHAAFTAVKKILETDATLIDYRVESITKGADATAEIVTIINDGHNLKQGRAVSTDVVQGSVESFLNALNR